VTSATFLRRRVFQVTANAELLHAFVVMPDHIHLLLTPQGITIERAVGLIKGGFSHLAAGIYGPPHSRCSGIQNQTQHPSQPRTCGNSGKQRISSAYRLGATKPLL
jgi:REP element-mobilizing transposase RayT